jgi:hypothetical protein
MKNGWKTMGAMALAGFAGALGASLFGARDASATRLDARYQVSSWAYGDASQPRHGAFITDVESGDTWVVVGRYVDAVDSVKLCKTDYPQGIQYVGKAKR